MVGIARSALLMYLWLTILTGFAYPLAMTAFGRAVFPHQSSGSLIVADQEPVGSELIGQPFQSAGYFWSRPSATGPLPYNAAAASGSNLGPTNPALRKAVQERVAALRAADPDNDEPVPVDLVTASASGLDPHLSPAAALYQVPRVARSRRIDAGELRRLVHQYTEDRTLGVLGEPRVNVLRLNLALDKLSAAPR